MGVQTSCSGKLLKVEHLLQFSYQVGTFVLKNECSFPSDRFQ